MGSAENGLEHSGYAFNQALQEEDASGRNLAECRICHDEDSPKNLLSPCKCHGSMLYIHFECLVKCIESKNMASCQICQADFKGIKTRTVRPTFGDFLSENPEYRTELIFAFLLVTMLNISLLCQVFRQSNETCSVWLQLLVLASFVAFYTVYMFHFYREWLIENVRVEVIKPDDS